MANGQGSRKFWLKCDKHALKFLTFVFDDYF